MVMDIHLTEQQQKELLRQARKVITRGCQQGLPPEVDYQDQPTVFQRPAACFVTLQKHGQLRGCIGSLEPQRPLLDDVLHNAFASAFRDTRFPLVQEQEIPDISIEISVLTPQQSINAPSEEVLLKVIRPGIDGLVIRAGFYSATFLPQVWEQLPDPKDFLAHLKQKAGMPVDYWPDDMECYRYQCFKIRE